MSTKFVLQDPRQGTSEIFKGCPSEWVLVHVDYSSIELRLYKQLCTQGVVPLDPSPQEASKDEQP